MGGRGIEHVGHGGLNAGVEGDNPESAREQLIKFIGGKRGIKLVAATLYAEKMATLKEAENLESFMAQDLAAIELRMVTRQIRMYSAGADGEKFDTAFDELDGIFKAYEAEHEQKPNHERIESSPVGAMQQDLREINSQIRQTR
jgi:hypothetical protein